MFTILQILVLLVISPFGLIIGWAYTIDSRLPFILMILSFDVGIALIMRLMRRESRSNLAEKVS